MKPAGKWGCRNRATYQPMRGITLTLSYDAAAPARPIFEALAECGRIHTPFQPAF